MKLSLLCCAFLSLFGCASAPVDTPIGIPDRPVLQLTVEDQQQIPPKVLAKIAIDYNTLKSHIKKLEQRILRHDEAL